MQITTTDIIATLRAVVNKNTKLYKEDFKQDIKIFREAAKNPDTPEEKRTFLWLCSANIHRSRQSKNH